MTDPLTPEEILRRRVADTLVLSDGSNCWNCGCSNVSYWRFSSEKQALDAARSVPAGPCSIEAAFSQHEYVVDYCETHDQPADQCTPVPAGDARVREAAQAVVDVFLRIPASLAMRHVAAINTLRAVLAPKEPDHE